MSNLRNIQFLRSQTVYNSLDLAKAALSGQAANLLDGSPIIGRYLYGSGETKEVKSLIGIAHKGVNNETGVTFFESANDVADHIAQLQSEMDATQAAVDLNADGTHKATTDKFTSGATTIAGEIKALNDALVALDADSVFDENKIVTDVTQADGKITATVANLTGVKLGGLTAGTGTKIAATDTLGGALANIQAQIDAMDKDASAVDGQVVTTVAEADGKVSEAKANVKDLQLGGYYKDTTATGDIASTDTINAALSKLENKAAAITIGNADGSINVTEAATGTDINVNIKDGEKVIRKDGNNGIYTDIAISAVTGNELTTLGANVREAYKFVDSYGGRLGDYVKVYKDQTLSGVTYSGQQMTFVYYLADGSTTAVTVDLSDLIQEQEYADGLQLINHVLSVKKDTGSTKVITAYSTTGNTESDVLTISEDGVKIDNIQNAINAAVGKAQTTINTAVTSSDETLPHMSIAETTADNGSKSYQFTTFDIASEDALDAEVTRAKDAEAALDLVLGSTKASDSETRTWTKENVHYIGNGPTVKADVTTLDAKLFELSGKTFTNVTSENGSITVSTAKTDAGTVKVDVQTVASQISGLTAVADANEGAAKVSGVSAADSVQTGIKNLYDSLKSEIAARKAAIVARTISGDSAISVTETPNADGFGTQLHLVLDGTTTGTGDEKTGNNALTITNSGLFLSNTWNCGEF